MADWTRSTLASCVAVATCVVAALHSPLAASLVSTGVLMFWIGLVSDVAYREGDPDPIYIEMPLLMARAAGVLLLAFAFVAAVARRREVRWRSASR